MGRLDGKIAIVTGGTSGIGRRTVELFVAEGAVTVFCGRREALGREIAAGLGATAEFHRLDVTDEAAFKALIDDTVARHGRLDVLVNNAGGPAPVGSIEGLPLDGTRAGMAVLFDSVMLGMKHAAPIMKRQQAGSIVNVASIAAHRSGMSSSMIYSAAKAAVVMLSKCVAMELGEHRVRVNTVSPGAIATGIFGKALGLPGESAEKTAGLLEGAFATAQPIPRAGLPDDIARAIVYFASDDSAFVNGTDLVVDGGMITGRHWTAQQQGLDGLRKAFGVGTGATNS